MIKVISTCHEKIQLKDIPDVIYYKQEKVYTDSQYSKSLDLKREISKGNIIVIEKREDGATYIPPSVLNPSTQIVINKESDDIGGKMDILLNKLLELEKKIENTPKGDLINSDSIIEVIVDKIKNIEDKINNGQNIDFMQALKKLEEKIVENAGAQSILSKLESMLERSGESKQKEKDIVTQLETYVPNIKVEDANTHITLNTRVIERSDDVSDALNALKKIKKGN